MKGFVSLTLTRKVVVLIAVLALLAVPLVALADNVENDVVTDPASITLQVGIPSSFVDVQFYIQGTGGDGDSQCNFDTLSEQLTFTINTPSGVTASPASLTFNKCHDGPNFNYQSVRFTASASGVPGNISFTQTFNNSGGTFDYSHGVLYVNVIVPPPSDTTPPTASPTQSPAANGNGWNSGDVTVTWNWSDNAGGSGIDSFNCTASSTSSGEGIITLTATCKDLAGNIGNASYTFKVDKTAPTITFDGPSTSAWYKADVTANWSCTDALSGPASASVSDTTSGEGAAQSATGTCTDLAGNTASDTQSFKVDKTAPTASASASPAPNANGWNKTDVTVSFSGSDGLSGIDSCDAAVVSSSEGAGQSASGTCTDLAGNVSAPATASGINIDKTAPSVSLVGGPADGDSYYFGFVPAAPTCSASDALSGLDGVCSVSGYSNTVGSHTVTASATDKAGNSASASASYTVLAWTLKGFYQPVDMTPVGGTAVWNTVKNGSTVPLKFEIFAGPTELTNTDYVVQPLKAVGVTCGSGTADDIELTATGGTSLRYDPTGSQFIYNWQTPKTAGACYKVTVSTTDGSSISAYFKLK